MIILLPWALLNMGDGSVSPITAPGLEYALPDGRMGYTFSEDRAHFTFEDEDR